MIERLSRLTPSGLRVIPAPVRAVEALVRWPRPLTQCSRRWRHSPRRSCSPTPGRLSARAGSERWSPSRRSRSSSTVRRNSRHGPRRSGSNVSPNASSSSRPVRSRQCSQSSDIHRSMWRRSRASSGRVRSSRQPRSSWPRIRRGSSARGPERCVAAPAPAAPATAQLGGTRHVRVESSQRARRDRPLEGGPVTLADRWLVADTAELVPPLIERVASRLVEAIEARRVGTSRP